MDMTAMQNLIEACAAECMMHSDMEHCVTCATACTEMAKACKAMMASMN